MAEGLARAAARSVYRFLSAGSAPGTLHPLAVAALAEVGLDISRQRAKGLSDITLADVDTVVTLCAEEVCPVVPGGVRRIHWPLPDPARVPGSAAQRLPAFPAARDRYRHTLPTP